MTDVCTRSAVYFLSSVQILQLFLLFFVDVWWGCFCSLACAVGSSRSYCSVFMDRGQPWLFRRSLHVTTGANEQSSFTFFLGVLCYWLVLAFCFIGKFLSFSWLRITFFCCFYHFDEFDKVLDNRSLLWFIGIYYKNLYPQMKFFEPLYTEQQLHIFPFPFGV